MPARRDKSGRWRYREVIMLQSGERTRISGTAPRHNNTKVACLQAFRDHVERLRNPAQVRDQAPTFAEWFTGRFWTEWVLGEQNKPSVQGEKDSALSRPPAT